jgi:hypothetical protein
MWRIALHALPAVLAGAAMIVTAAQAEETLPAGFPAAALAALSPLMSGVAGGVACDFTVERSVGAAYLRAKIGADASFDVEGAMFLIWMDQAQRQMQFEAGVWPKTASALPAYCLDVIRSFGPRGSVIPGLLTK